MDQLRYPIGKFSADPEFDEGKKEQWIDQIAATPARLRASVADLTPQQLETPYRPGGWTVRQLVHHLPDSHLNAYVRFRLALTEEEPTIKTYEEARWAELPDARSAPIDPSLSLLEALHTRWVILLRALGRDDFSRTLRHPDWGRMSLATALQIYAWHGRHHVAHVTRLRQRQGWQ